MVITALSLASAEQRERMFFLLMGYVLATLTVAGFTFNLAMGRATFAVPPIYYVHAFFFFGWVVLYVAQNTLICFNNVNMHRRLGRLALFWVPVMVALGVAMTITSVRRTGGPVFFGVSEFLFVNCMHVVGFAALTGLAIAMHHRTDWHRRLMLSSMALVCAPGIARLLPSPMFIPYTFLVIFSVAMLFPLIGLLTDLRRNGRMHPAWLWGIGLSFAVLLIGEMLGASAEGQRMTDELIAGTPGADRPIDAYAPSR